MTQCCQHCNSEGRIQVQAVIEAPAALAHQFSKQNMRRSDVFFRGVLWETMDFICSNPDCQRVTNGYGNYVTDLKKRADALEAENAGLRGHVRRLQHACMVVLEDWWPLVYDRTCRNVVKAQGEMVRNAIADAPPAAQSEGTNV